MFTRARWVVVMVVLFVLSVMGCESNRNHSRTQDRTPYSAPSASSCH